MCIRDRFGTFKKQGWHLREPGADYPREEPYRFHQTVYRALAEDIIGESKAVELLGKQQNELPRFHANAVGS